MLLASLLNIRIECGDFASWSVFHNDRIRSRIYHDVWLGKLQPEYG